MCILYEDDDDTLITRMFVSVAVEGYIDPSMCMESFAAVEGYIDPLDGNSGTISYTAACAPHRHYLVHIAKSLDESGNSQLSKLLQIIKIIVSILKQLAFVIGDDGNLIWQSFVCV